jgi:hypothetical protein
VLNVSVKPKEHTIVTKNEDGSETSSTIKTYDSDRELEIVAFPAV